MYNMEKHRTLDTPPNLPFFTGAKRGNVEVEISSEFSRHQVQSSATISHGKRVNLRSESIKQLVDWHSHLEKGGISKEQYDEVQHAILKDIKDNMV